MWLRLSLHFAMLRCAVLGSAAPCCLQAGLAGLNGGVVPCHSHVYVCMYGTRTHTKQCWTRVLSCTVSNAMRVPWVGITQSSTQKSLLHVSHYWRVAASHTRKCDVCLPGCLRQAERPTVCACMPATSIHTNLPFVRACCTWPYTRVACAESGEVAACMYRCPACL